MDFGFYSNVPQNAKKAVSAVSAAIFVLSRTMGQTPVRPLFLTEGGIVLSLLKEHILKAA
jgi:hypothetical protein